MSKKIVVVIPAYKAAETLPSVLARIVPEMYERLLKILVVEDGGETVPRSTSAELLEKYPKVEVLFHEHNRGYGGAQKTGYRRALELGADIAAMVHADGQYAPEELERLCQPMVDDSADMVLGSRMRSWRSALKGGMPKYKFVANICLTQLENLVYGLHFSEYHSGYMLYSRKALETIPFEKLSDTFHFDGEMLLVGAKRGLRVADLPIPTRYGDEESHLKPIKYGFEVLGVIRDYLRGKYDFNED
ncbi:glycosyltransferase involved in cell wall biosynthesis [Ereboglobus sp. PH5-10]|uniref:glycosyltransferase family 2 protein n=1 Tax=Ereboglobus sp. PH5-10 TaxID=2940629 RepID=UPI0024052E9B|nr:glycosyltransferase family 2 protein [Ereboglobus sp. PH5-10]MDF9827429.1 glycosyltransferase involved in cell wall biosynthesis [Ereboglobus sp. PH5-10]